MLSILAMFTRINLMIILGKPMPYFLLLIRSLDLNNLLGQNRVLINSVSILLFTLSVGTFAAASDEHLETATFSTLQIVAKTGSPPAQRILASMYEQGDGVERDIAKAIKWYRSAAELNDDIAQFYLGYLYYQAIGLEQDYNLAFHWFARAAEQGNADFQYNLGNLHRYGERTVVNIDNALKWYNLAANQDQSNAQLDLAHLYLKGEQVTRDLVQAYVWFSLALEQIDTGQEIKLLSEKMSAEQLKVARKNVTLWLDKNRGNYEK